jgi:hypothetical protein
MIHRTMCPKISDLSGRPPRRYYLPRLLHTSESAAGAELALRVLPSLLDTLCAQCAGRRWPEDR